MREHELMEIVYRAYVTLLIAFSVAAMFQKRGDMARFWSFVVAVSPLRRTALAMLANWSINTAFVIATGVHDAALWFIATDVAAAFAVLHQPAARAQAAIGAVYMAQIVMHAVYLLSDPSLAEQRYWQILIALAFVQLLILGGWTIGHHGGKLARRLRLRGRAALAGAESQKSVDP